MPLNAFRRHSRSCTAKHHYPITELDKCKCPIMLMGLDSNENYHDREATGTSEIHIANRIIRDIEDGKIARPQPIAQTWTIEKALETLRGILIKQRGLKPHSMGCHLVVHRSLIKFAKKEGISYLKELTPDLMDAWVSTWDIENSTLVNRINLVKRMFSMAHRRAWITMDPSIELLRPRVARTGTTLPFDLEHELPKLMEAAPHWRDGLKYKRTHPASMSIWSKCPETGSALVVLLRCSGLRISDAFKFDINRIQKRTINGEEMYCYFAPHQQKTGEPVFIPILPEDAECILGAKWISNEYAFWDGKTPMDKWHHVFVKGVLIPLGRLAGVDNIHPHRFRDTFAMELLQQGVDIRSVSRLLGHKNVATTMAYYEHYIRSDQDKMLSIRLKAWKNKDAGKMKNIVSIAKAG